MLRWTTLTLLCVAAVCTGAQESQPQLRLNIVEVCTPADAERNEIEAALKRIPARPAFSPDFEIARGSTTGERGLAKWVRIRRELNSPNTPNVQYMFSTNGTGGDEAIVVHLRAAKPGEPLQIALEQSVTAGTPSAVAAADTPPNRIRVERYGKASLILARCPNADQAKYEPLFRAATERFAAYRAALKVSSTVPAELARISPAAAKPAKKH
ncbi:MAG: hypothetical protein ACE14L_13000 [Terriglobales bacterium]